MKSIIFNGSHKSSQLKNNQISLKSNNKDKDYLKNKSQKFAKLNCIGNFDNKKNDEDKSSKRIIDLKKIKTVKYLIKEEQSNEINSKNIESKINAIKINIAKKHSLYNSDNDNEKDLFSNNNKAAFENFPNDSPVINNININHNVNSTNNFETINNSLYNNKIAQLKQRKENELNNNDIFYFEEPVSTPYGDGFFIGSYQIDNITFARIKFFSVGFGFIK